jgi:hypothetical protein
MRGIAAAARLTSTASATPEEFHGAAAEFSQLVDRPFAMPAAEIPTLPMIEAAYRHHGLDAR